MKFCLTIALAFFALFAFSQQTESPYRKFGKITLEELQKKLYPGDSSANAVVLSDIGNIAVEGNTKGWFGTNFTRHRVVHILNKNGYDLANVVIPLYVDGTDEEKLLNVKAVTYNVENGKIIETKMERSAIFKEKVSDKRFNQKFTLPNVKEGCIVEYEYTVTSDFIWNLDPWYFQDDFPTVWSELSFSVPQFYTYSFLSRGYHPIAISDKKDRNESFTVSDTRGTSATERYNFTSGVTDYRWVMKDIPGLKREAFTFSTANHRSRIEFQLISQGMPLTPKEFRTNWPTFIKSMLENDYFGKAIGSSNNWLNDDIKPVVSNTVSELQRAQNIFQYVRDHFTTTGSGNIYLTETLKTIMKAKKGTAADINLLLTAMLRYAGINADPVILSTTNHGYAQQYFPMSANYNYVVVRCKADGKYFYLDATEPLLGFGKLLPYCYNGHARVINEEGQPVFLQADSLKESQATLIIISNSSNGKWQGSVSQVPGYYASYRIREKIKEKGKESFFSQVEKDFGLDVKINQPEIDSLTKLEMPVKLQYSFDINKENAEVLYINPMFGEGMKKNPFVSANRYYPVEMPYATDETYVMNMEVPAGYVVDELPKQVLAKFDEEGNTFFEYRISQSENVISFRSRIKVARALFMPDEYEILREFFNMVVKKQGEQIVFKKKK